MRTLSWILTCVFCLLFPVAYVSYRMTQSDGSDE